MRSAAYKDEREREREYNCNKINKLKKVRTRGEGKLDPRIKTAVSDHVGVGGITKSLWFPYLVERRHHVEVTRLPSAGSSFFTFSTHVLGITGETLN